MKKDDWKKIRSEIDAIMATTRPVRKEMARNAHLYAGELWNKDTDIDSIYFGYPGKSEIQYNLIFATIESLAPLVTDNRPITRVAPMFPFLEKIGIALNNVTKYAWNTLDLQRKTYLWVKDAMIKKFGVWEVGYDDNTNNPTVELVDLLYFFMAPGYVDVWDAPFAGWRKMMPVSWVHKHFPDVKELKGTVAATEGGEDKYERPKNMLKFGAEVNPIAMASRFLRVYKIWMRDDDAIEDVVDPDGKKTGKKKKKYPYGKICWFSNDQYLGDQACTDEHNKPPFVMLPNYDKPDDASGISDVDMIRSLHEESNLLLKYWVEYLRRFHNPNMLADTDSDFPVQEYKDKASEGGQTFAYSGSSMFGKDGPPLVPVLEPPLNPQIPTFFQFLQKMAEEVSGATDITKGQVGKQERQSASEVAILLESSHTRVRQKVRNLEWALKRAYYLILRNVQQYWTEPKQMVWQESEGADYAMYGNSYAQADDLMKPKEPMPNSQKGENWLQLKMESGLPLNEQEQAAWDMYQQEWEDYKSFLEYFKVDDEFDPIYIDFDIQVQTDSMLPMDKQQRVNTYLRLQSIAPPPAQIPMFAAVLDELEIPERDKIIKEMHQEDVAAQMPKQSPQDMAAMKANPQAAAQYQQAIAGGQQ